MPDSLLPPPPPLPSEFATRRSPGTWIAAVAALATALGSAAATLKQSGESDQAAAAVYETLRQADIDKGRRLDELARGQAELRAWIAVLAERIEARTSHTEAVMRRLVPRRAAAAWQEPEPLPPPPAAAPPPPAPPALPAFEELGK